MSAWEGIVNVVGTLISNAWVFLLAGVLYWLREPLRRIVESLARTDLRQLIPELLTLRALSRGAIKRLESGDAGDKGEAVLPDLEKVCQVASSRIDALSSTARRFRSAFGETGEIARSAKRKLVQIFQQLKDPNERIPEDIFVSETYGYGVGSAEMSHMLKHGWIEVLEEETQYVIRLTETGKKYAGGSGGRGTSDSK